MTSKIIFKHFTHLTLILTFIISLTSCTWGRDKIHLEYLPRQTQCPQISGTNDANVEIVVHDKRLNMTNLGCKGFGHDQDDIGIELEEDLSELIAGALNLELNHFNESSSDRWVEVEVHKFHNEFKVCGWMSGKAEAELILLVQVKNSINQIIYSRVIVGKEQMEIQVPFAYNAQIALEAALNDAIHQLLDDPAFFNALSEEYS